MSKIKTNNYNQATKEIGSMDQELTAKIPQEIEKQDSKLYHVALVKISTRPGEVKNDVSVNIVGYHKHGFEKIQKSFMFQGYNKLILVHDPSAKAAPSETEKEKAAKILEAEKQLALDSLEQAKKLVDTKSDDNDSDDDSKEPTELEILEKEFQFAIGGNKPELVHFADKNKIDLGASTNNEQRKEVITNWFNAKMDPQS